MVKFKFESKLRKWFSIEKKKKKKTQKNIYYFG